MKEKTTEKKADNLRKKLYKLENFIGKKVDKVLVEEDDLIDEDDGDHGFTFSIGFIMPGVSDSSKFESGKEWKGKSCWVEFECDKTNKILSVERSIESSGKETVFLKKFEKQNIEDEAITILENYLV